MKYDWVKKRRKVLRNIWHSLKIEEKELASKGIFISYANAQQELEKLMPEIEKIPVDDPPPERLLHRADRKPING
jgi:hypothetical protein